MKKTICVLMVLVTIIASGCSAQSEASSQSTSENPQQATSEASSKTDSASQAGEVSAQQAQAPSQATAEVSLYDKGLGVISKIDTLAESEQYLQIVGGSDQIKLIISAIGEEDYSQPNAVYAIEGAEKAMVSYLSEEEVELDEEIFELVKGRFIPMLASQLNASSSVDNLAASSILTYSDNSIYAGITQPVAYAYLYDNYSFIVAFVPGNENIITATGNIVFGDTLSDLLTNTLTTQLLMATMGLTDISITELTQSSNAPASSESAVSENSTSPSSSEEQPSASSSSNSEATALDPASSAASIPQTDNQAPIIVEEATDYQDGAIIISYATLLGDGETVTIESEDDKSTILNYANAMQYSEYTVENVPPRAGHININVDVHMDGSIIEYVFSDYIVDGNYLGKHLADPYSWTIISEESFVFLASFFENLEY